jgi:hypothetical protein
MVYYEEIEFKKLKTTSLRAACFDPCFNSLSLTRVYHLKKETSLQSLDW